MFGKWKKAASVAVIFGMLFTLLPHACGVYADGGVVLSENYTDGSVITADLAGLGWRSEENLSWVNPGSTTLSVPPPGGDRPASKFPDVGAGRWSYEFIQSLAEKGILTGNEKGLFEPERSITREEFLKILFEALTLAKPENANTGFSDVVFGCWYEPYIAGGVNLGIVNGLSPEYFGVGKPISRQDMAVMISRAGVCLNLELEDDAEAEFSDSCQISDYARAAVSALAQCGILAGNGQREFCPKLNATREEAAKVIYFVMEKFETESK